MSFATLEGVLASAVADAGTFSGSYPSGTGRGDFVNGAEHKLLVNQTLYAAPADFTIAFGASTWTITWSGGYTLAAESRYRVQLDMPGEAATLLDASGDEVLNTVPVTPVWIDLGAPAASDDDALRAAASISAAGDLTLLSAGQTFDVPRNVIITSAGDDSADTFTVTGTDAYGDTVVETITGANIGVAAGKKAFKTITTISASGASAGTVKIGYGDVLGLPVHLPVTSLVLKEIEDSAAATAGTLVAGLSVLTEATATNADVRGTYDPNSACDGSKSFQILAAVPNATFKGVPQYAG